MQSHKLTNPKQICENLLAEGKRYNTEHNILPSENIIADRLLARSVEMQEVYNELYDKLIQHPPALEVFLRIILSTAAFWSPENVSKARRQKKELTLLNEAIFEKSANLVLLLKKRDALHNGSGFAGNTHYSVCGVIEAAAKNNYLFGSYVKKPLAALRGQFDLKYWPTIDDFLSEISEDANNAELYATDPITEAATTGIRSSRADYFKALLQTVQESSARKFGQLPQDFKLTDNALATIGNCALDLGPDELVDEAYIKRFRQRQRSEAEINPQVKD